MRANEFVRVVKRIKGAQAVSSTGQALGHVTDVYVHPTEGCWLGVLLETPEGARYACAADYCQFVSKPCLLTLSENALVSPQKFTDAHAGCALVCQQLIGARVISEQGELLGYVSEILLQPETHTTLYHIAVANWRRWFRLGFYLAGNAPRFYSSFGSRLIVPANQQPLDVTTEPHHIHVNR